MSTFLTHKINRFTLKQFGRSFSWFTLRSEATKGFTLIELIIVIAILGVLFTMTLVAINPLRQIAQAKNTKRKSDTVALLNAAQQYLTDHGGSLPTPVSAAPTEISKAGVDLCSGFVPVYIAALPVDPQLTSPNVTTALCSSNYVTGYFISKDTQGQITVAAPNAEYGEVVSYTR